MKYLGAIELQIRAYDGFFDGCDRWTFYRNVVGVVTDDGVYDYKTGDKYHIIFRKDGLLDAKREDIVIDEIYGLERSGSKLKKDTPYTNKQIDRQIASSTHYTQEYKKMKRYPFKFSK